MAVPEAQAASTAKKVAGQTDKRGRCSDVCCLSSICHRPNALQLQEMPYSAAGLIGEVWTGGAVRAGTRVCVSMEFPGSCCPSKRDVKHTQHALWRAKWGI